MLPQHQPPRRNADFLGKDDFVRQGILQNSVLMDSRFVRERVRADHCLVRRHGYAGNRGEQTAGRIDVFEDDVGDRAEIALPHVQRYGDLFQRSVSGAFADSVDRALDLPRPAGDSRKRICNRKSKVVMAVRAQLHLGVFGKMFRAR